MTDQELKQYCEAVTVPDREIMDAARRRQAELAKPPGSLRKLEDYSIRLAGITGQVRPHVEKCRVLVLAADNGVTAEGISSAPTSVTLSQVINMTRHNMTAKSAIGCHCTLQIHLTASVKRSQRASPQCFRHHICGKSILFQRNHRQADTIYRNTVSDPGSTEYFFCPYRNLPG